MYRPGNNASILRISSNKDKLELNFNIFSAVPSSETTIPLNKDNNISNYFV